jgi:hypothetical protein
MATVRWHLDELTGATLVLRLVNLTTGAISNGAGDDELEEGSNGLRTASVEESLSGWHKAYADEGGEVSASGFVNMSEASPVVVETIASTQPIGTGARTVAITVNDGTDPIEAATVRLTQGAESYALSTNASGLVTFNVDDATWQVGITKAGYSFAGASLVVNGNEAQTYSMTAVAITPSDPGATTGYLTVRDGAGEAVAGETVQVKVTKLANGTTGSGIDNPLVTGTTDVVGLVEFPGLPRLATYEVRIGEGKWFRGVTADAATTPLAGVLGVAE